MSKRKAVKGKDLMLFVGGKAIALATTCEMTLTANTEDAATKDSGGWEDPEVVGHNWAVSSDAVCGVSQESPTDITYDDLMDLCIAGEPVEIMFGLAGNASTSEVPTTGWTAPTTGRKGSAIIESVKYTAPNKQNSTLSVSLKGKGKLGKIETV